MTKYEAKYMYALYVYVFICYMHARFQITLYN